MPESLPIIALTAGDIAGIGPEILLRAILNEDVRRSCQPVLLSQPQILKRAAKLIDTDALPEFKVIDRLPDDRDELAELLNESSSANQWLCCDPGRDDLSSVPSGTVDARAGDAAYRYLIAATTAARNGVVDGITTAPLNKEALHAAGHNYPGHTEILADECGVEDFAMMLYLPESRLSPLRRVVMDRASGHFSTQTAGLSVVHVTLHTSIASVPNLLTNEAIAEKIRLLNTFLAGIQCERRSIGVCALNPHGGENGLFGNEEQNLIRPAIADCEPDCVNVVGPLPVDTLFRRAVCGEFDGVVAMYHDQGHIPVKLIGFDSAVNITLGLPIVRTSPTHGTAFDRAWSRATPADASGMVEAILMATRLC